MPKISPAEYEELKAFLGYFSEHFFDMRGLAPELRPLGVLATLERKFPAKAAPGLWMAVRDCVEMSEHWTSERVLELNTRLKEHGLLTLSELRLRLERRRAGILTARSRGTRARAARAPQRGR
jgi:hypothetical protein